MKLTAGGAAPLGGWLVRDGDVPGVRRASADALARLQQLFPEPLGVLAEHHVDVGVQHRPQAAVDLALQLAGTPADIADEVARLVRRGLDYVVDRVGAEREV